VCLGAEGVLDEITDAEDGGDVADKLGAAEIRGIAALAVNGTEDEEAELVAGFLDEAEGAGGVREAGIAGELEGGAALGIGFEIEAKSRPILVQRLDHVDGDVRGPDGCQDEAAGGIELGEGEAWDAVLARLLFECLALRVRDAGIPGKGLYLRVPREGFGAEIMEAGAGDISPNGAKLADGMENFHGALDLVSEKLCALAGCCTGFDLGAAALEIPKNEEKCQRNRDA
jgi:hypothetical protein